MPLSQDFAWRGDVVMRPEFNSKDSCCLKSETNAKLLIPTRRNKRKIVNLNITFYSTVFAH